MGTVGDRLRSLADRADALGDQIAEKATTFIEDLIAKLENALAATENGTDPAEGNVAETLPPATEEGIIEGEDADEAPPPEGAAPA